MNQSESCSRQKQEKGHFLRVAQQAPPAPHTPLVGIQSLFIHQHPRAPSHLPSFLVPRQGNTEDVGGFFHDSDEQVVDVILQLPNLEILPGDGVLLFQHQLDQLIVCQLGIGIGRV